jgi:glucose-6-phosphate dehydrogenase assembly protein OpcA
VSDLVTIEDASIKAIERELVRLRDSIGEDGPRQRTRVMNHVAWVPERWADAALETLAGLEHRHPSRGILLFPRPDDERDAIDAAVDVRCFARGKEAPICSEVIELHLRGARAAAPASVVEPLLTADLPDFLRWRGDLPFGAPELEQLLGVVERLVVDSREWRDPEAAFARLPELFERVIVSDIAWARTEPWREAVARLWPAIAEAAAVRVAGPRAEALLLRGWLSGCLSREFELEHEPAGEIELVEVGGEAAVPGRIAQKSASDLLSDQLDIFSRDPMYEEAVRSFSRVPI